MIDDALGLLALLVGVILGLAAAEVCIWVIDRLQPTRWARRRERRIYTQIR